MKRIFKITFIAAAIAISSGLYAQSPPPPNGNGGDPTSGGHTPVGGGAPIGSGLVILMALGAAYGSKKAFDIKTTNNEKPQ